MPTFKQSQYKIRFSVGTLGILLPLFLLIGHDLNLLSSMSHYYYTASIIFFIGVIASFSLALFCYQGYPKTDSERFSDSAITTLASIFAVIVVLVPTGSEGALGELDYYEQPYLFGYKEDFITNSIHLFSAGIFIALLGYMSFAKFSMGKDDMKSFYKICGLFVWASIFFIALFKLLEVLKVINDFNEVFPYYVFWLECIAIWAFGIAWLVKAKPMRIFISSDNNE